MDPREKCTLKIDERSAFTLALPTGFRRLTDIFW